MIQLLQNLLHTQPEWAGLVLRLSLGLMILPHGAQKLLGWFGGYGFSGTMGFFTGNLGIPALLALLVILGESFGGILLILGLGTRVAAIWIGIIMLAAMLMAHWQHGFFMNWFGAQKGEGIEFFVLAIGISVSLLFTGGGRFSIDSILS